MINNRLNYALLFLIFFSNSSFGQNQDDSSFFNKKRFNAGFVAGLNTSELAGEGLDSFVGWNAGILGAASITNKLHFSLELLISQNGEYLTPEFFPDLNYSKVKLNFIEVPFQINFQLQQNKEISDRKGWIRTGLAVVHLLDSELIANEIEVSNLIIWEKENAILVNFGGAFFLNRHLGIDVRMSLPIDAEDLIPTISFRGIYLL